MLVLGFPLPVCGDSEEFCSAIVRIFSFFFFFF